MKDNPKGLRELQEMHHLLNEVLNLGFRYLVVRGIRHNCAYIHVITPDWLAKCTMMPFRKDHTLCTNPLARQLLNGYQMVNDRETFSEIPAQDDVPQPRRVCKACLAALQDEVWPQFEDDEVFMEKEQIA